MPVPPVPDAPRIAYDIDGSTVFMSQTAISPSTPYEVKSAAVAALNADRGHGLAVTSSWWLIPAEVADYVNKNYLTILFPSPTTLTAMFLSALSSWHTSNPLGSPMYLPMDVEIQTSKDTTNGLDGTWVLASVHEGSLPSVPAVDISSTTELPARLPDGTNAAFSARFPAFEMYQPATEFGVGWEHLFGGMFRNVRGVRLWFPQRPQDANTIFGVLALNLHLYGTRGELATENRLEFVGDSLLVGDMETTETVQKVVRLKNLSTTLTADSPVVSVVSSIPAEVPTSSASTQISLDGLSWSNTVTLADIAPGAESADIFVRVLPAAGTIGYRHVRLKATTEVWLT